MLVPGWASDHRIFDSLDIEYNYLLPVDFSPNKLADDLPAALREYKLQTISALGWSMGAFAIWGLLSRYPDVIEKAFLVSARRGYSKTNNDNIKTLLEKNRRGFLIKFYSECFSIEDRSSFGIFKSGIMKDYLECMDLKRLVEGLDYLSEHTIEPCRLSGTKVRFIHGAQDAVAPLDEVKELASQMPETKLITIEGAGHMPFLSPDFKESLA